MSESQSDNPSGGGFLGGIMSGLKKIGLAEEVQDAPPAATAPQAPTAATHPAASNRPPLPPRPRAIPGARPVDPKFRVFIEKVMDDVPGDTLQRFHAIERPLKSAIADEATRFKAIFAMATAQGLTAQQVIETIDASLTLLKEQSTAFREHLAEKSAESVATRRGEAEIIQRRITELEAEIAALQKSANDLRRDLGQVNSGINAESAKLNAAQSEFDQAVADKEAELSQLRTKVNLYGPKA